MSKCGNLDEAIIAARRLESALTLALRAGDGCISTVAAARLALTLLRAVHEVDDSNGVDPAERTAAISMLARRAQGMYELLCRAPMNPRRCDPHRLRRWIAARGSSAKLLDGPHIFELDAAGVDLSGAQLLGVHLVRCRLITSLHGARLVDAIIDDTDLAYSDLRDTRWQNTQVNRSAFRQGCMIDASLEHTTFCDCDLRDVDLGVTQPEISTSEVRFVRCDLRGAHWAGRDLSRVSFVDCRAERDVVDASLYQGERGAALASWRK